MTGAPGSGTRRFMRYCPMEEAQRIASGFAKTMSCPSCGAIELNSKDASARGCRNCACEKSPPIAWPSESGDIKYLNAAEVGNFAVLRLRLTERFANK